MVPYSQSVDLCMLDKISGMGLDKQDLAAYTGRLAAAMEILEDPVPEYAAILRSVELGTACGLEPDELDRWRRKYTQVIVLGMGGSALGARTALSLRQTDPDTVGTGPEIHVIDDFDAMRLQQLLAGEVANHTGLIIVSKSGGTNETLSLAIIALQILQIALPPEALSLACLAIAVPGDSPLRKLAARFRFPVLGHDPDLGGRFSVFSETGMLPAALAGIDVAAIRDGARAVIKAAMATTWPNECAPAVGAAIAFGLAQERDIKTSVLLAYHPDLREFGLWYRQLWAESLGKDGKGTTPVRAMAPEDQHSQLQLYLDGPVDKYFTALAFNHAGEGPEIETELALEVGLDHLAGRHSGDLLAAMQRGTIEALARRGRPVRTLAMQRFDAPTLGALFMHFILETILAADLWNVDPFGQPAVEEGKKLVLGYLQTSDNEAAQ